MSNKANHDNSVEDGRCRKIKGKGREGERKRGREGVYDSVNLSSVINFHV